MTDGFSYSVSVNEAITDVNLWRIIINGYPYKSIQELGCNNKQEAFTATKQAIYCYIHGNNPNDYQAIGEAGQRTLNALNKILRDAKNSNETQISNNVKINREADTFKVDNINKECVSKIYSIKAGTTITNYKVNLSATKGQLPEEIKITDLNNNEKQEFSQNEKFKILIPIKNLRNNGSFNIKIETKIKNKPVLYGKAPDSNYQDYALTTATYEDAKGKTEDDFYKNETKIKIIKQDKDDNSVRLAGVKFKILNEEDECIEKLETDENGEALSKDLVIGDYYIKEVETKDSYVLNNEKIKASVKFNETNEITIENEKIKGKIQINKLSEDKNNILETEVGSPIEGVKFNIYDMENKLVDTIVTDKNGVAASKKLEKGRYNVQEIETNKWYILDKKIYEAEIKENNEIVKLDIVNKSKDPKIEIKKSCKNITKSNDEIDYSFEIKNTGNVELEDFTWYDYLPADYAKITGIETGTYNKDILYNIYYKTNQKDEYMVLKKNLNGGEDNFISLTDLHLEKDEKITEIKIYFGNVDVGFKSEKKPHIIMKTNENLKNDTKIENSTVLEGYNQDYRVSSKDTAVSTIYNVVQEKKLPRTGF